MQYYAMQKNGNNGIIKMFYMTLCKKSVVAFGLGTVNPATAWM